MPDLRIRTTTPVRVTGPKEFLMSCSRTVSLILAGLALGLAVSSPGRAEDALSSDIGILNKGLIASTRPNSFLSAIPGGRFVLTVAHVAPAPEDAVVRGVPAVCDSVRFRVDTLVVGSADGAIEIETGEVQSLEPGQAARFVREVDRGAGAGVPVHELDMVGFRIRAEKAASRCGIVASGLLFPSDDTTSPLPIALIPDLGPSPALPKGR